MIDNKGIKNCNGCQACMVACKRNDIKIEVQEDGFKKPVVNMDGCAKCNACRLYCPLYMPVEMPEFDQVCEVEGDIYGRDMAPIYRKTMREVKANQHTEFVGTLCQIAALKSLLGDKIPPNLFLVPVVCDRENPRNSGCANCQFYK